MKLRFRLLIALLSLVAVGAVVYVRASASNNEPALAKAPAAEESCDCDAPATKPSAALPAVYQTTPSAPATPAKN